MATIRLPRFRAGFVSHRQRSWDLPFGAFSFREGIRFVSERKHPPTVSLAGIPSPEGGGRLDKPRFLGFSPSGSPLRPDVVLIRPPPDAPLGFPPLGPATSALTEISLRLLSRACPPGLTGQWRHRVSIGVRSAPPFSGGKPLDRGWSNPSGVFAPARILNIQACNHPGYVFTFRRIAHCCRLIGDPWMAYRPTGVVRIG